MPCRVLLADDHVVVREGLRSLLEEQGFEVVAEALNGQDAVKRSCETRPDVAILDLAMPILGGVEASEAIHKACPSVRTIALTVHCEGPYVLAALGAGFSGYVLKSQAGSELIQAITDVTRGAVYLSPSVGQAVVDGYLGKASLPRDFLTPREREVLQLLASGKSTRQIAEVLGISERTAESHRKRIKAKLHIRDTAGLVRYAIRRGLIEA